MDASHNFTVSRLRFPPFTIAPRWAVVEARLMERRLKAAITRCGHRGSRLRTLYRQLRANRRSSDVLDLWLSDMRLAVETECLNACGYYARLARTA